MDFSTADFCDEFEPVIQVVRMMFRDYGAHRKFWGRVVTLEIFEDNQLVRETLQNRAVGRVLVIDGGGSLRCAVIGDKLAALAYKNGWAGVVINGCVRDSKRLAQVPIGIKALYTSPGRSAKAGAGARNVHLNFGGTIFKPNDYLYADEDGVIVSERRLLPSPPQAQ